MVRLVFRPYTRVGRSICTSEPRRSSTRVSSGFNLPGHSSPSFGSRPIRSRSLQPARWCLEGPVVRSLLERERSHLGIDKRLLCFRSALGFSILRTREWVRLLGPCFKTGRLRCRPRRGGSHHLGSGLRESTRRRSNGAGQRPAPVQLNCHGDPHPRRPR